MVRITCVIEQMDSAAPIDGDLRLQAIFGNPHEARLITCGRERLTGETRESARASENCLSPGNHLLGF